MNTSRVLRGSCLGLFAVVVFSLGCAASGPPSRARVAAREPSASPPPGPVRIILDSDLSLDVDDVGALALLHALADRGEAQILGVVISESLHNYDGLWGPPLADIINTHYGRPDIPVGIYKGPHQDIGRYGTYAEKVVKAGFPHDIVDAFQAEDSVALYRRLLADAPDASVVIVTTGYLTNLSGLLRSLPDDVSPLSGMDLVRMKVREWSCMGGAYPSSGETGEFNLGHYPDQSEYVINNWPVRVMFTGYELGRKVKTGGTLVKRHDAASHPVALAWHYYNGGQPRESWDELAVLYGVRGLEHAGQPYFKAITDGHNRYEKLGVRWPNSTLEKSQNVWVPGDGKPHGYLRVARSPDNVATVIEELITADPGVGPKVAKNKEPGLGR